MQKINCSPALDEDSAGRMLTERLQQKFSRTFLFHGARRWMGRQEEWRTSVSAEQAGFDLLLTVDQALRHQQNLAGRKIALLIVQARSNKVADLLIHIPACLEALNCIGPGQILLVG